MSLDNKNTDELQEEVVEETTETIEETAETVDEATDQSDAEETVEDQTADSVGVVEYLKNNKVLAGIIVAVVIILAVLVSTLSNNTSKETNLAELKWVMDTDKIEELKSTLIDGVSLEDIYSGSNVTRWRYAMEDEVEYLQVETEEDLDIYDVTDGELVDSLDLLEVKKSYVDREGQYTGEVAEFELSLDENYDVIVKLAMIEIEEVVMDEETDELEEVVTEETETDEIEEVEESEEVETVEVEVEVEQAEVEEVGIVEVELEEVELEEELEELEVQELTYDLQLHGSVVSENSVEFTLETGEIVVFQWVENDRVFVSGMYEFSDTIKLVMPVIIEALNERYYEFQGAIEEQEELEHEVEEETEEETEDEVELEEETEEEPEVNEDYHFNYNGNFGVEITSHTTEKVKFNLILLATTDMEQNLETEDEVEAEDESDESEEDLEEDAEEDLEEDTEEESEEDLEEEIEVVTEEENKFTGVSVDTVVIKDGEAHSDGDIYVYSDDDFRIIIFQKISDDEMLVTGYDYDMNMVIRIIIEM